jgi:hypothetical protein
MTQKPSAAGIATFIHSLASALALKGQRSSWPTHLFRVDDVRSAASILNGGVLYPRSAAVKRGLLVHDSASPGVIEHTPEWCKACVRLYFRPRTPTEYRSEGFRPAQEITMGAHRPMPIALIFDSVPVLTAIGTSFTEGNASTKGCRRGDDLTFLQSIPFAKVYHDTWISDDERDVIFRRCAEVLVPESLPLTHLKHVFCRSQAEYETLYSLLNFQTRRALSAKIGVSAALHFKKWTYVESAELAEDRVMFRFSPSTKTPGPFRIELNVLERDGSVLGRWRSDEYHANDRLVVSLHSRLSTYVVELTLDGELAYRSVFTSEEALM